MRLQTSKRIKAVFKGGDSQERHYFYRYRCMLTISVGQEIHYGEKFLATLKLIERSFKECVVMVCDVLQRHTLRISQPELSDDQSYQLAQQLGDDWLEVYRPHIEALKIPQTLLRWEDFINQKDYHLHAQKISDKIESSSSFNQAFDLNCHEFIARALKRNPQIDTKLAYDQTLLYLKEESAVMCMQINTGCHYEVYPSRRNASMAVTYNEFVKPFHPELLHPVQFKIKKTGSNNSPAELD